MTLKNKYLYGQLDWNCGGETYWSAYTAADGKHVEVHLSYPDGTVFGGGEDLTFKTWGKANAFLREVNAVIDGAPTPIKDAYIARCKEIGHVWW